MKQIQYTTIRKAPRKILDKLRQIGIEKAQRLETIQERWERGEYREAQTITI